ncbi:MAG: MFS transporter [Bacteroidia bacterium]|nr:MFS transporter [Bacteroidia bacterium]
MSRSSNKVKNAWAMYDWANSVYSLVITSTIFPIYYSAISSGDGSDKVSLFGFEFINSALYSFAISFVFLVTAAIAPILSGVADYGGYKKRFMQFFCYLGGFACISLFLFDSKELLGFGLACFVIAGIGYSGSIVFYNSFLPIIAEKREHDKLSAKGYALGYVGSSLLLIFSLTMVLMPDLYGIADDSMAPRISFVLTGIWWIGFAQITFAHLPKEHGTAEIKHHIITNGYKELRKVWIELKTNKVLKNYLLGFFFFTMGVQTVMYVATLFGDKELQLESSQLIITILIIQFVAIGGAYLFAWLSSRFGNIMALLVAVFIWIGICVAAYFVYSAMEFYALAFVVGMVMGGIQSLSRSTYSKMLPETVDHASYFAFYDVGEKIAIVIGTASYGLINELTGGMRPSIFVLAAFFIVGVFLLLKQYRLSPLKD